MTQELTTEGFALCFPQLFQFVFPHLTLEERKNLKTLPLIDGVVIRDAINIDLGLTWDTTPQGHMYWGDIHQRMGRLGQVRRR